MKKFKEALKLEIEIHDNKHSVIGESCMFLTLILIGALFVCIHIIASEPEASELAESAFEVVLVLAFSLVSITICVIILLSVSYKAKISYINIIYVNKNDLNKLLIKAYLKYSKNKKYNKDNKKLIEKIVNSILLDRNDKSYADFNCYYKYSSYHRENKIQHVFNYMTLKQVVELNTLIYNFLNKFIDNTITEEWVFYNIINCELLIYKTMNINTNLELEEHINLIKKIKLMLYIQYNKQGDIEWMHYKEFKDEMKCLKHKIKELKNGQILKI